MKRIRIPSTWREAGGFNRPRCAVADFQLGLGPCGKVVTALNGYIRNDCYCVDQICDDGERKIFRYPLHTITGRIEETY